MLLRYHKSKDPAKLGGLTVIRDDGTTEYQALPMAPGFMAHELCHFAAETELGLRDSFLALLARGHTLGQFSRTDENWTGGLPQEALQTEFLVGQFQSELMGCDGVQLDAPTFSAQLGLACESAGLARPRALSEPELARVRTRVRELLDQWRAVSPGSVMELRFPAGSHASA